MKLAKKYRSEDFVKINEKGLEGVEGLEGLEGLESLGSLDGLAV